MVDGPALTTIVIGGVFAYAGIKGKSVLQTAQSFISGAGPATTPQSATIAGIPTNSRGVNANTSVGDVFTDIPPQITSGNPQAVLQQIAATFGWGSGAQWQALQALEMREAEFNPTKKNPSSGAYGLAQSLGHHFSGGPASNGINEYGGQGLTPAQSRAASSGDPVPQALWMMRYIRGKYGNPVNAYKLWLSRTPHWY